MRGWARLTIPWSVVSSSCSSLGNAVISATSRWRGGGKRGRTGGVFAMIPQTSGKRLVVAQAYIYQLLPGVGDAAHYAAKRRTGRHAWCGWRRASDSQATPTRSGTERCFGSLTRRRRVMLWRARSRGQCGRPPLREVGPHAGAPLAIDRRRCELEPPPCPACSSTAAINTTLSMIRRTRKNVYSIKALDDSGVNHLNRKYHGT